MPPQETPSPASPSTAPYIGGAVLLAVIGALLWWVFLSSSRPTPVQTEVTPDGFQAEMNIQSAPKAPGAAPKAPGDAPSAAPTDAPKPPASRLGAAAAIAAESIEGEAVASTDASTDENGNHWDEARGMWVSADGLLWDSEAGVWKDENGSHWDVEQNTWISADGLIWDSTNSYWKDTYGNHWDDKAGAWVSEDGLIWDDSRKVWKDATGNYWDESLKVWVSVEGFRWDGTVWTDEGGNRWDETKGQWIDVSGRFYWSTETNDWVEL